MLHWETNQPATHNMLGWIKNFIAFENETENLFLTFQMETHRWSDILVYFFTTWKLGTPYWMPSILYTLYCIHMQGLVCIHTNWWTTFEYFKHVIHFKWRLADKPAYITYIDVFISANCNLYTCLFHIYFLLVKLGKASIINMIFKITKL